MEKWVKCTKCQEPMSMEVECDYVGKTVRHVQVCATCIYKAMMKP